MKSLNSSSGFSIISLMIAVSISIFIIGAIGKMYINSKTAYQSRMALAAATDSGRFAIQNLRRTLVMAGRGILSGDDNPEQYNNVDNFKRTFPALSPDGSTAESTQGIVDRDDQGSSIIAIRYGSGPSPCGVNGTISSTQTVRYYVENEALICDVVGGQKHTLASGVLMMRALYGIDLDVDNIANQYLSAACVDNYTNCSSSGDSQWSRVVSIRIGLIVSSNEALLPGPFRLAEAESLGILGERYTAPDTRHFYKSVSTTITLRNLNVIVHRQ